MGTNRLYVVHRKLPLVLLKLMGYLNIFIRDIKFSLVGDMSYTKLISRWSKRGERWCSWTKRKGENQNFLIEYAGRNYWWRKIGRLLCWLVQLSAWLNWELGFPEFPSIYDSELASAKRGSCVRLRSRSRKVAITLWRSYCDQRQTQRFPVGPACPHFSTCQALLLDIGLCCTTACPRVITTPLMAVDTQRQLLIDFIPHKLLPWGLPLHQSYMTSQVPLGSSNLFFCINTLKRLVSNIFLRYSNPLFAHHFISSFHNCIRSNSSTQSLIWTLTGTLLPRLILKEYRKFWLEVKSYHSIKSTIYSIFFEIAASRGWKGN